MMSGEVFESHIWLQMRMRTVNIFTSLHLQMAQAWRDPKITDLCHFFCERENGQKSEAAGQLGNFLFVQKNFGGVQMALFSVP